MAQPIDTSGNKMSLRSKALDQIKRLDSIAGFLGSLGDVLVSTLLSILIALATLTVLILIDLWLLLHSPGIHNLWGTTIPFILFLIGAIGISLNVLLINPSQGSQIIVSIKYWYGLFNDSTKGYIQHIKPFRFARESGDNDVVTTKYKGKKYYFAMFKVQGKVAKTSFDADLELLSQLNRESLRALERDTQRTTINFISIPKIEKKVVNQNATPAMKARAEVLEGVVKNLGNLQTLETYIVLSSTNYRTLEVKVANQLNFYNRGLVTSVHQLKGKQLKTQIKKFVG